MNEHEAVITDALDRIERGITSMKNLQANRRKDLVTTQAVLRQKQIRSDIDRIGGKVEGLEIAAGFLYEGLRQIEAEDENE